MTTTTARLHKVNDTWELLVDEKPFLILGGELHNSSMSSSRYMSQVWQTLADSGINTVLGAVSWEDIESREGEFQFTELDVIIEGAKTHGLRLIILWFGSFKNGKSSYVPAWVKTDPQRFPRMYIRDADGRLANSGVLSIFHDKCYKADARAFTRLLQHLRDNDKYRTVIMVQVENEVGLRFDSRCRSAVAEKAFKSPVPSELFKFIVTKRQNLHPDFNYYPGDYLETLGKGGRNWEEVFGQSIWTDELFMAYHYARYVEYVASSGRKEYDIPLFTNAWLARPGEAGAAAGGGTPGEYPSGGPVSTALDIWQRFAPGLSFLSPDIYTAPYSETCETYSHNGQPLFIPEQRRDAVGARQVWISIGTYKAIGTSPFGIDTLKPMVNHFVEAYKLLKSVSSLIIHARREGQQIVGFAFENPPLPGQVDATPEFTIGFKDYQVTIDRAFVFGKKAAGYGMIIELEPTKFLLVGKGFKAEWKSRSSTLPYTDIISFLEKSVDVETQELRTERVLNGDESNGGTRANMPNDDPDYGDAIVPVLIPARTGIAVVQVFSLPNEEV
ncbi:hypothetical protein FOVG_17762 [Fusarium oxysporum f. sp. pisi HDV247]|uniref:Beta-galactosidase n=1 Tax=Fusarium oxysporum f. sp. pisi HDV247 TaxID=1080344 RepID=W9NSX2_FUSOX|nr:hypothetical protein FOVG_17762 [Fusarium oxysporum f. sp. pisi HDV247]